VVCVPNTRAPEKEGRRLDNDERPWASTVYDGDSQDDREGFHRPSPENKVGQARTNRAEPPAPQEPGCLGRTQASHGFSSGRKAQRMRQGSG